MPRLLQRVVPPEQNFDSSYTGMFRYRVTKNIYSHEWLKYKVIACLKGVPYMVIISEYWIIIVVCWHVPPRHLESMLEKLSLPTKYDKFFILKGNINHLTITMLINCQNSTAIRVFNCLIFILFKLIEIFFLCLLALQRKYFLIFISFRFSLEIFNLILLYFLTEHVETVIKFFFVVV